MPEWRLARVGVENMTLAVMGCVVNGPGESKHASMPTRIIHFTPRRRKKKGMSNIKTISDICPIVMKDAASS